MTEPKTYEVIIPQYPLKMVFSFETDFEVFKRDTMTILEIEDCEPLDHFESYFAAPTDKGKTARLATGNVVVVFGGVNHGLLAHELFHAATLYLDAHDIRFSWETQEVYAYFIQYITDTVYQIINSNE